MVDTYNDTLVKTFRMHLKSLNSNKLWTSVNNDVSILVHQNANIEAQGLGYMWMVGRLCILGRGRQAYGNSLYFPLSFAVTLKLL